MNDQLVIAKGVSIRTLNPHNNALKNDYFENILTTAFMVFPIVAEVVGKSKQFRIKRGFQSHAYILNEVNPAADGDLLKHAKGLALEFTWEDWSDDDALLAASALFEQADEPVKIIVDIEECTLYVTRGVNVSTIIERTHGKSRVIKKEAA